MGFGHEVDYHFWSQDPSLEVAEALRGTVFIDGSCQNVGPRPWHLATWSVIAQDERGAMTACLSGAVGRQLPQTSAAGEYVAGLAVAHHCGLTDTVFSDYQSLAGLHSLEQSQLAYPGNYYSGVRWLFRSGRAWKPQNKIEKVKAHQDLTSLAEGSPELWQAQGNEHADKQAKFAAARYNRPEPVERELYNMQEVALDAFLRYASEALLLWDAPKRRRPKSKSQAKAKPRPARQPAKNLRVGMASAAEIGGPWLDGQVLSSLSGLQLPQSEGASECAERVGRGEQHHQWAFVEGRWICRVCLARAKSLRVCPYSAGCPGRNEIIRGLWRQPKGHDLLMARTTSGDEVVVICKRCAYYTEGHRAVKLASECLGVRTKVSEQTWRRLTKLQHPNTRRGPAKVMEPHLLHLTALSV